MSKKILISLSILFLLFLYQILPISNSNADVPKLSTDNPTNSVRELTVNDIELKDIHVNQMKVDSTLLLINSEYPIPKKASEFATKTAYPTVPVSTSDVKLHPNALEAAATWFEDAKQMGYDGLYVNSGYRNYDKQKLLYDHATDKAYVQKPGNSEHHTGLAVDVAALGIEDLGKTQMGKWLMENAWKYGYLLRYPEDKIAVTGIAYEPWHFRYVGFPHAFYCQEKNLSLEEYLKKLKNEGGYSLILNSTSYTVFYNEPKHGIIQVPKDLNYEISSDNMGGYIITVKDAPLSN